MTFVKRILTPPVFDDEDKTQQAFMLNIILWSLVLVPIPLMLYTLVFAPQNTARLLAQTVFGEVINITLLIMLRRGYVRAASIIQVSAFWVFLTVSAVTDGGVQGEAYLLGYGLLIAIAGILLGGVGALSFTILSLVAGAAMVYGHARGLISAGFRDPPITTWFLSLVLFPVSALLQHVSSLALRNALSRARASEEKYRLISRVTSDYTFSTELDATGNMHLNWVAGAFESMTGFTYDEYVASGGWLAHLYPADVEEDKRAMKTLHSNNKVISEVRIYNKNGQLRWVRSYAHPVWDNDQNRLIGIAGAVQDITEKQEAREREMRRRAMLEKVVHLGKHVTEVTDLRVTLERIWHGVHDGLGFDRLAIFLYNHERNSFDGTLGTNNQGQIVEEWDQWYPISDATIFNRVLQEPDALYFTRNYDIENQVTEDNEMYGVKDYAAVAAWAGNKPIAVICVDNLKSRRPMDDEHLEALQLFGGYAGLAIENSRLNTSLQKELNQRQILIHELEAKNAELERFTYTVSHDLKSPLVTITGFLGYLEKDAVAGNIEKVRSGIQRISKAAKKMELLLSDLLELSRVGRLMSTPENVSFEEIVNDALERVRGSIETNHVRVEIQENLPVIHGDKVRLVEVMQNLLDNAAKFSVGQPDAFIKIGARGMDERQHHIFYVCDNGIGIEPRFHERVFGLFNKLNPQIDGTGIGLTLVKRLIEVHGGRIWVESEPGEGATFYFTLPPEKYQENEE
ncbi:MAG TPA: ATP-binding protein [Anaerolineales bacterium]|nr:ATP-binding protein [Anaerolineales bacterium]